jgi:hypothetical protein
MKIKIISTVKTNFQQVAGGFNEKLFRFLLPSEKIARLIRYDGEKTGGIIHIRFSFPWASDWISKITDSKKQTNEYYFIDKGVKLPFGLKCWKHRHVVKKINANNTRIVDEIDFSTAYQLVDFLIYPILYLAFVTRKMSYRNYFKVRKSNRVLQQANQLKVQITY